LVDLIFIDFRIRKVSYIKVRNHRFNMSKALIWIILIMTLAVAVNGAMDPIRAFCIKQGYQFSYPNGDRIAYCVLDDGYKCEAWDFYNKMCRTDKIIKLDCVKKGEEIFASFETCCEGKPYHSVLIGGQSKCLSFSQRFWLDVKYEPFYWFLELIIVSYIIYKIFRKYL